MTSKTRAHTATAAGSTFLSRQYIWGPLSAQTIGVSTIKGTIRVLESAPNDNLNAMRLLVRVVSHDGTTYRTPVLYGPTNGTVAEFNTSLRAKRLAVGGATASVVVTAGDYLVIEVGTTTTVGGTSLSDSISYGDDSGTDLGDNETDTSAYNPFIEIAADIALSGLVRTAADTLASLSEAVGRACSFARGATDGVLGGGYSTEVLADSPNAYFRFDGTGDYLDSIAGGNAGVATGSVTRISTGPDGPAVTLGGATTDAIVVPYETRLDLGNGPFSLEVWLRRTTSGVEESPLAKGTNSYGLCFNGDGGGHLDRLALNKPGFGKICESSSATTDTDWHHYVITHNGIGAGNTLVYKDGAEGHVDVNIDNGVFDAPTSDLRVGSELGWRGFAGDMAELALYPAVLSATRIAAHYTAATTGGLLESLSRVKGSPRTAADAVASLAEAAARGTTAWVRTGADSVATLAEDAVRAAMAKARTGADSVSSIAEAVVGVVSGGAQALVATAGDAIATLTEVVSRAGVFARTPADNLPTLAEITSRAGVFARSGADNLATLAETAARAAMAKARTIGDSAATLTESVVRAAAAKARTGGDSVSTLTESAVRAGVFARTLPDSLSTLTETAARAAMAKARTSADGLSTLAETVVRGATAWVRTGADTLGAISEAVVAVEAGVHDYVATVADNIATITEAASRGTKAWVRTGADSVSTLAEDAARAAAAKARTASASVATLTESVARAAMAKAREAGDTIASLGETVGRAGAFGRTAAGAIGAISESVIGSIVGPTIKGLAVAISSRIHQALTGNAPAPSTAATSVSVHRAVSGRASVGSAYASSALVGPAKVRTAADSVSSIAEAVVSVINGGVLQDRIDAQAEGTTLTLTGCSYSAGAVISKPLTIIGGTITVASGLGLEIDGASDVTIEGTVIHGGDTAYGGIWAREADRLVVRGTTVTDFVYAGIMVLSSSDGQIVDNLVQRIGYTAAPGENAYGIEFSEWSDERQTDHFLCDGNTVEDVPIWHGIGTHSGQYLTISNNTIRRVSRAIFLSTAYGLQAGNIVLSGNQVLSPSPVTYNLTPVTLYDVAGIEIDHQLIEGWGAASPPQNHPYYDYGDLSTDIVLGDGNVVTP